MKKQGCEIEAIGIDYKVLTRKRMFLQLERKKIGKEVDLESKCEQPWKLEEETGEKTRHVLKKVNVRANPWEVLAIVGPSGAGKSSLLEILATKLIPQNGSIFVNKKPIDRVNFKKISGYVTQKDSLFPLLTVEETLMFSAKLRLNLPKEELKSRVKSLVHELGLEDVSTARVGDDRIRGISGGERRRVSIGVEVIHDPKVLILDEPTSGLDSASALQIVDMVKKMAESRGRTVILTIHQPGFRIVKLFNTVVLLADGSVLHHGSVEQLGDYFISIGLQLPVHVNSVEFAIDSIDAIREQQIRSESQISQEKRTEEIHGESRSGNFTLQQLFQQSRVADEETMATNFEFRSNFANSRIRETVILTHRFSKNISRTKELFRCRTIQMLISGLVLGSIFHNLKTDLIGAREKVGLFAFILTFLLSSTIEALPIFLQEREILMKEISSGNYRISSYIIANSLVYLPFLLILAILFSIPVYWLVGLNPNFMAFLHFLLLVWLILYTANSVVVCLSALVPNFIVGNSIISGIMGSYFLFSGYFISKHEIPSYWIFMHYISLFKYPFEGFLINEFSKSDECLQFVMGQCLITEEGVLREEGYEEESRWRYVGIMICFILFYRFMSYVILRCRCSQKGF